MKILIDSSVWIEYFSGGPRALELQKYFKSSNKITLPSIVSYEVYKKIKSQKGERLAVLLLAQMERLADKNVSLDQPLAIQAADISLQYNLPMADAVIYSTASFHEAIVVTMDAHFRHLPNVKFFG